MLLTATQQLFMQKKKFLKHDRIFIEEYKKYLKKHNISYMHEA